ncbi:MAG: type I-C CRISPR-associated protein Cas8c/Csd1 [Thermomicrobiales bacterium]
MLLEKLREYAVVELGQDLPPAGYQKQPVRYIIAFTDDGRLITPVLDTKDRETPRGTLRLAPHVKRASGIAPKLLADTAEYVLGVARDDPKKPPKPERVAQQHAQFIDLVEECARDTGEASVAVVARFLRDGAQLPAEQIAALDASAAISFRVGSIYPVDLPSVQAWWAKRRAPAKAAAGDPVDQDECIVCGAIGSVLERHPLKIKGIPGGQILKDLISGNAKAFESYGMEASRNAPTCALCAEAYGNALNALLADKTTSIWTKELAYAFWTEPKPQRKASFAPVPYLTRPQEHPGEVRALLESVWGGKADATSLDPSRFYAVALGASGARVVVKDWLDTTVGEAQRRLARYFMLQELVQWNGEPSTYLPMGWIANSTVHEKGTPTPNVGRSLLRLAFGGEPLPLDLLYQAVRRNRAEQAARRERAVLIKMVMGSRGLIHMEERGIMTGLDPNDDHPAYLCGRLLETLSQIQFVALGQTNSTVVSRYYGTASASPQTVFPSLLRTSGAHLRRMQRDTPGAHNRLDRQLQEILWNLDGRFPRMFNAEDQGRFALGFYHQRASNRHAAEERRTRNAERTQQAALTEEPTA